MRHRWLVALAMVLAGVLQASSQNWPSKPVRIIVPVTAGSATDVTARVIADHLTQQIGQPVVVENRTGAGGTTGMGYVAKSVEPDGYTILVHSAAFVIQPATFPNLGYDSGKDFAGVTLLGNAPLVMIASPTKYKTLKDLVTWSKANPAASNYGSASPTFTLAAELFKLRTGASMQRVSYRGSNDAVVAVLSNQVTTAFTDTLPAIPLLKDGKLRALAVTSPARLPELPDVPTMTEAGITGAEAVFWTGLFVPKGTPKDILQRLETEVRAAMQDPEVRQRLRALATDATSSTPAEFTERITADLKAWGAVAKAANVTVE